MLNESRTNIVLNVSRLQEVELPLGGENRDQEGGESTPFHFLVQSEILQPPKPLSHEGSPSWVPAVWPRNTLDCSRFFR